MSTRFAFRPDGIVVERLQAGGRWGSRRRHWYLAAVAPDRSTADLVHGECRLTVPVRPRQRATLAAWAARVAQGGGHYAPDGSWRDPPSSGS